MYNTKYVYNIIYSIYIHTVHICMLISMRQKSIHSFLDLPNLERWRLPRGDVGLVGLGGAIGPVGPGQGDHLGTRWGPVGDPKILRNWWMDGKSPCFGLAKFWRKAIFFKNELETVNVHCQAGLLEGLEGCDP